ncbi:MAG: hypothetical protein FJ144_23280 [Deltaproteobacteria bacterium]|nr:hypothetical protein [Deltaproteobacteria bacterium]
MVILGGQAPDRMRLGARLVEVPATDRRAPSACEDAVAPILLPQRAMDLSDVIESKFSSRTFPTVALLERLPDGIVSAQWEWGGASIAARSPEARLMLAVLEDAMATLSRNARARSRAERRALAEVQEWYGEDDCSWPFSFVNVCEMLGLDVSKMRHGLSRWVERAKSSRPRHIRRLGGQRRRRTRLVA